jgi:hypothetical protein
MEQAYYQCPRCNGTKLTIQAKSYADWELEQDGTLGTQLTEATLPYHTANSTVTCNTCSFCSTRQCFALYAMRGY